MATYVMIVLRSVTKYVGQWGHRKLVLDDVNAVFAPRTNWVIFGGRGSGKTTLLNLICGAANPNRGSISRRGLIGQPVGTNLPLALNETAQQIAARTARLYKANVPKILAFTAYFSELGDAMKLPLGSLPTEARFQFNYAMGYALPLDFYLFDMTIGPSNEPFKTICRDAFDQRRAEAGTIFATRHTRNARDYGDHGAVLADGKLFICDTLSQAIDVFEEMELSSKIGTVEYAEVLIEGGDFDRAYEYLRELTEINPQSARAFALLGGVTFKLGYYDQAIEACQTAALLDPAAIEPHLLLAKIAEFSGRLKDAAGHAKLLLALDPRNREASTLLARVYESSGSPNEAADVWRSYATLNGQVGTLRATLRADIRAGNWENVLNVADVIIERVGDDAALMHTRARAWVELNNLVEAEKVLTKLIPMDVKKALQIVDTVRRKGNIEDTMMLLRLFHPSQLAANRQSPYLLGTVGLIERDIRAARRVGDVKRVQILSAHIHAIDPSRASPTEPRAP